MKYCQSHWEALREAIRSRGLNHLIAANGREAVARTKAELEGKAELADYDPLMAAHNMVMARATGLFGLYLFTGEYCPVCEAIKAYAGQVSAGEIEKDYTDGPADAVLAFCRENGIAVADA